jgi:hypothetical protein
MKGGEQEPPRLARGAARTAAVKVIVVVVRFQVRR